MLVQTAAPRPISPKEVLRRIWWWSQATPGVDGSWDAGWTRLSIPASTTFGAFEVDLLYPTEPRSDGWAKLGALARRLLRPTSASLVPDAPVAPSAKALPVIIYFPSWFSRGQENSFTLANLARHGFAVVALDDVVHIPLRSSSDKLVQAAVLEMSSDAAFARSRELAGQRIDLEARLGSVILDSVLAQRGAALDGGRVFALGFSFGGGAAAAMSLNDRRIQAVVNLDGSLFGDAARRGVACPYLAIFGGDLVPTPEQLTQPDLSARFEAIMNQEEVDRQVRDRDREGHWTLLMSDAEHLDFSDRLIAPAFRDRRSRQTLDRLAMWYELNDRLLRFFGNPRTAFKPEVAGSFAGGSMLRPILFGREASAH